MAKKNTGNQGNQKSNSSKGGQRDSKASGKTRQNENFKGANRPPKKK